jgi:hypothetical protein
MIKNRNKKFILKNKVNFDTVSIYLFARCS